MVSKRHASAEPSPTVSPIAIREMATAFQRSRVLLTAFELGIFTALDGASRSSSQVAATLRAEKRATDRLMNALCAMGFLRKRGGRFSNTPHASRFLVKGKPEYMAGLMHTVHLWNTWSTLTQAVRRGTSVATRPADESAAKWRTAFIAAMHDRASKVALSVVEMLDLSHVSRVLDVGGGSGAYSMAFARAKKGLSATVFDLPDIIPLTEEYVRREERLDKGGSSRNRKKSLLDRKRSLSDGDAGLSDRIDFVSGDYTVDDFGKGSRRAGAGTGQQADAGRTESRGYDLVFLSATIHSNSVAENRRLMRKCAKVLNPGGQVVVQDFIVNEDRTGPAPAVLFTLNMLVNTEAGDTYTETEVRAWMKAAGLHRIARKDTEFGTTLIVGKRTHR
ncbi:MAG: methyltransferase [Candidatus Eisenbacteria bacterium]|nr:methyltransferase [Candidatus Eisenbacteria bacterium]